MRSHPRGHHAADPHRHEARVRVYSFHRSSETVGGSGRADSTTSSSTPAAVIADDTPLRHDRRPYTVDPSAIRVHDGDTFYVGPETIRLRGIDTPELGEPLAMSATLRLIALLHEGPVTIVPRAEDVYGRTVADVYVRGRDVAAVLRAEGFAKPTSRTRTRRSRYNRAGTDRWNRRITI